MASAFGIFSDQDHGEKGRLRYEHICSLSQTQFSSHVCIQIRTRRQMHIEVHIHIHIHISWLFMLDTGTACVWYVQACTCVCRRSSGSSLMSRCIITGASAYDHSFISVGIVARTLFPFLLNSVVLVAR